MLNTNRARSPAAFTVESLSPHRIPDSTRTYDLIDGLNMTDGMRNGPKILPEMILENLRIAACTAQRGSDHLYRSHALARRPCLRRRSYMEATPKSAPRFFIVSEFAHGCTRADLVRRRPRGRMAAFDCADRLRVSATRAPTEFNSSAASLLPSRAR